MSRFITRRSKTAISSKLVYFKDYKIYIRVLTNTKKCECMGLDEVHNKSRASVTKFRIYQQSLALNLLNRVYVRVRGAW